MCLCTNGTLKNFSHLKWFYCVSVNGKKVTEKWNFLNDHYNEPNKYIWLVSCGWSIRSAFAAFQHSCWNRYIVKKICTEAALRRVFTSFKFQLCDAEIKSIFIFFPTYPLGKLKIFKARTVTKKCVRLQLAYRWYIWFMVVCNKIVFMLNYSVVVEISIDAWICFVLLICVHHNTQ